MSTDPTVDDSEDVDLAAVERDAVSTGAAADSADWDERLKGLPRLAALRHADQPQSPSYQAAADRRDQ